MLSKPRYGWTTVTIGNFKGSASYLTDVPLDVLNQLIYSFENQVPFVCAFDCEGYEFTVVSNHYETYILIHDEDTELITIEIDNYTLAKEVKDDILNNLEDWVKWVDYMEYGKEMIDLRRQCILNKVEELDKFIYRRSEIDENF